MNRTDQLDVWQRVVAASGAGVVSSLVVNPLDVVKIRMQAQAGGVQSARPAGFGTFSTLGLTPWLERGALELPYMHQPAQAPQYRSATQSLGKIARHEGLPSLWQGTNLGLMIAVPLVAIYLPLYDLFSAQLTSGSLGYLTPLVAGCGARAVAALAISPLELVKTRLQATNQSHVTGQQPLAAVLGQLKQESQRVRSLWRGIGATLAKDIPFAGVYWMLLEPARTTVVPAAFHAAVSLRELFPSATADAEPRQQQQEQDGAAALAPSPAAGPLAARQPQAGSPQVRIVSQQSSLSDTVSIPGHHGDQDSGKTDAGNRGQHQESPASISRCVLEQGSTSQKPHSIADVVAVNAVAAALAAGLGGALTTPLDVVKTHAQTSENAQGLTTFQTLITLWKRGGMQALFAGAGPRTIRTMAAYSILMSSYELCKLSYSN